MYIKNNKAKNHNVICGFLFRIVHKILNMHKLLLEN